MRRVVKLANSIVIREGWRYNENGNNTNLRNALLQEQLKFCAYTDTYIGRTDKYDLDHFNPNLKGSDEDNYYNWYIVKAQWNSEKSKKWNHYQPIIPPYHPDLELRIVYDRGDYIISNPADIEANNLIRLVKLDDPDLATERKRYISRRKKEIENANLSPEKYFTILINDDIGDIRFIRAIREEFGIDIENLIINMIIQQDN